MLRGPSAVLYGAGGSGGLLNAVSKRPDFKFGGQLGVEFGNFDRKQVQADITGGLNDAGTLAGRFVGVLRDGELQSKGQANDKYVLMPSLTWKPTADTDVTLIGMYQEEQLGTQTWRSLKAHPWPARRLLLNSLLTLRAATSVLLTDFPARGQAQNGADFIAARCRIVMLRPPRVAPLAPSLLAAALCCVSPDADANTGDDADEATVNAI